MLLEPKETLVDGVSVRLGDQDITVPPMNLKALKKATPLLAKLREFDATKNDVPPSDVMDALLQLVEMALSRNYKNVSAELLEEVVDMNNLPLLIEATMNSSGLRRTQPGEPLATGTIQ
jgi:hypothetical protein